MKNNEVSELRIYGSPASVEFKRQTSKEQNAELLYKKKMRELECVELIRQHYLKKTVV